MFISWGCTVLAVCYCVIDHPQTQQLNTTNIFPQGVSGIGPGPGSAVSSGQDLLRVLTGCCPLEAGLGGAAPGSSCCRKGPLLYGLPARGPCFLAAQASV